MDTGMLVDNTTGSNITRVEFKVSKLLPLPGVPV